jgi:hypothetical protein
MFKKVVRQLADFFNILTRAMHGTLQSSVRFRTVRQKMMATSGTSCRWWFVGLLVIVGVQLIFGMMLDGQVLASTYQNESSHDRPYADTGRSADILDEAQEQDDSAMGPDGGNRPPIPIPSGLRWHHPLMPGQLQLMPGPFRPPRLFQ